MLFDKRVLMVEFAQHHEVRKRGVQNLKENYCVNGEWRSLIGQMGRISLF